jgi:hypothetical protein
MGVMVPPRPKANPIMRLDTMERPLGASVCARVTPSGRVAIDEKARQEMSG